MFRQEGNEKKKEKEEEGGKEKVGCFVNAVVIDCWKKKFGQRNHFKVRNIFSLRNSIIVMRKQQLTVKIS